jgi:hypothetical protein
MPFNVTAVAAHSTATAKTPITIAVSQTQTAEATRLRQSELRPLEGQSPGSLKTASDVRAVGDGSHHLMFGRAKPRDP